MDAFDADVLIYAALRGHGLGRRVRALFDERPTVGIGSVLLLPEVLSKPRREGAYEELAELGALLGRLQLWPVDLVTAELAVALVRRRASRRGRGSPCHCGRRRG